MFNRSFVTLSRLCAVAAVVMLGTTAAVQVALAAPSTAAGSSVAIFAWGDNSSGELGNGNTTNVLTPLAVSFPPGVTPTVISGGGGQGDPQPSQYAAYAIGSDGHLYAWGDNSRGALGNGSTTNSSTPVLVSLPSGVTPTAITASQGTGYAIGSDGNLYAWGDNFYGTLGNGTSVSFSDTPVVVSLPTGVTPTAIAGGYESGYAIGSDGHLYAWGDNFYGELGNGNKPNGSATPVLVSLPSGVTPKAIAGGGGTGYAMGSDGNLYAWGLNASGQLGDGSTTDSSTPVVVSLPVGVTPTAIAGAGGFAYAIGSDGLLYAWGNDSGGQLGNGSTTNSSTPVVVLLPSGVTPKDISGNYYVGYAIGSDGNLYAWGGNGSGDLGDGTTTNSSTPVLVSLPPGSTPQKLGSEPGSASGYAIVNAPDVAPSITTQPINASVFAGQDATFSTAASGFPTPTVQWQVSTDGGVTFSPVSGATSDTLTIAATTLSENGNEYEAVFTNGASPDAVTNPVTLKVSPDVAPAITTDPLSQTVYSGQTETWTVGASGSPTPTLDWQVSVDNGVTWIDLGAVTGDTLTSAPLTAFENGWKIQAVFTNPAGRATTTAATINVLPDIPPTITADPLSQTVASGQTETWTVGASGTPTPTVDWQVSVDGGVTWVDLGAVTGDTVTSVPLTPFENGWEIRAVFTNGGGSARTTAATITVT